MNYAPFLPFGKRGFSLSREKRNRIPDTPGFPQSKSAPPPSSITVFVWVYAVYIFFLYLCLTLHLLSPCLQGVGKSDLENTLLFMFMSRESARCLVFSINLIVVLSLRRGVLPYRLTGEYVKYFPSNRRKKKKKNIRVFKIRKVRSLRVGLSDPFSKRFCLHHFSVSGNINKNNLLQNYCHKFTFVIEELRGIIVCDRKITFREN